jgi:uncharacterized protein DUF3108
MVKLSTLFALLLMLGITESGLAADLQPYEAVYASKLKGFNVQVKRSLKVQGDEVSVTVKVKKFWFGLHENSVLRFRNDDRLYPSTYLHKRRGMSRDHDKDLVFNWSDASVIDLLHPEREPLPVEKPSYDKLSYQTQMRLDLMRNPDMQYVEYCVTNGFRNRIYSFHRLSAEVLETPLGKLNTIKFKREGDDDNRQVFVWVASDWDFLLVRIDQTKETGGKTERLLLKRANFAGRKVAGLPRRLANDAAPVESP